MQIVRLLLVFCLVIGVSLILSSCAPKPESTQTTTPTVQEETSTPEEETHEHEEEVSSEEEETTGTATE